MTSDDRCQAPPRAQGAQCAAETDRWIQVGFLLMGASFPSPQIFILKGNTSKQQAELLEYMEMIRSSQETVPYSV